MKEILIEKVQIPNVADQRRSILVQCLLDFPQNSTKHNQITPELGCRF